jgi:hypothetical protein
MVHVDDRRPLWAGRGAPIEELERRERGEVCGIPLEPDIIWTSHKESPIAGQRIGNLTLVQVSLTDCLVPGKRSWRKAPVRTAIYVLAVVCLAVFPCRFPCFPGRRLTRPAQDGMSGVEELRLLTDHGEMLVAWHLPPRDGHPLILYFHGNGGALVDRVPRFCQIRHRRRLGAVEVALDHDAEAADAVIIQGHFPSLNFVHQQST